MPFFVCVQSFRAFSKIKLHLGRRLLICVAPATWGTAAGFDPYKWRGTAIQSRLLRLWTPSAAVNAQPEATGSSAQRTQPGVFAPRRHRTHVVSTSWPTRRTHGHGVMDIFARQHSLEAEVRGNKAVSVWREAARFGLATVPLPSVSALARVLMYCWCWAPLPGPNTHG